MFDFITRPFDPTGFPARWSCGTWTEAHGWTYVLSDVAIFGAYLAIPILLAYFLKKRQDLPFPKVGWLFVGFILFCGTTHLIDAVIFWNPIYRFSAIMRFVTAAVSWATVIALVPTIPVALALRSPADLQREVEERTLELTREKEENARLAQMVRSAADAIVALDREGQVVHANTAAGMLYGHDLAGRKGGSEPERYAKIFREVLSGLRVPDVEVSRPSPSGEMRILSLTLSPIFGSEGEIIGVTEIARDLSERRQTERLFRAVVEAAPSAMVLLNEEGAIVLSNLRATEIFGVSQARLASVGLETLLPQLGQEQLSERSQGELDDLASRLSVGCGPNGVSIAVEVGLTAVTQNQKQYVLAAISDVSKREAQARALEMASAELERRVEERTLALKQSNKDLEQFANVVSHDLAEPLRMVASFTELLQEQADQLNEEGRTFLNFAHDGAKRMQSMLKGLFAYSQLGRGPVSVDSASVDKALDEALENLVLRVKSSGAEITRDPKPLPSIQANPLQLTQLLQNLVSNAIKFSGQGPPKIHISVAEEESAWTLCVSDQGVGFDPAQGERIFEIFHRLHRGDVPGTGVGLAVCRRIVERHRGSITASGTPGQGARFEVKFPKDGASL